MSLSPPRTKANSCLFCGEILTTPSKCRYCGFRFCADHVATDSHQCGKTRYAEYVRKRGDSVPDLATGHFVVVCDICGYKSAKGALIEFAGEELVQHMQIVGCSGHTFLEEVGASRLFNSKSVRISPDDSYVEEKGKPGESIVEQLSKLASMRDSGVLSDDEFLFIKKEILKRLK